MTFERVTDVCSYLYRSYRVKCAAVFAEVLALEQLLGDGSRAKPLLPAEDVLNVEVKISSKTQERRGRRHLCVLLIFFFHFCVDVTVIVLVSEGVSALG